MDGGFGRTSIDKQLRIKSHKILTPVIARALEDEAAKTDELKHEH